MRNIRWISDFCKKIWVLTLTMVEARQRGSHAGEVGGRASVGTHASEGMLAPAKLPRWRALSHAGVGDPCRRGPALASEGSSPARPGPRQRAKVTLARS